MTPTMKTPDSDPMVSVVMIAYNSAPFIERAIQGVLRQKTDFSIELLIADDASSDGTPGIIRRYASAYPHIIRPLFHPRNLGVQGNYLSLFPLARGKYMAMCDADDYWSSRRKLSRQVSYMESHPQCAICFHRVINYFQPSAIKSLSAKPQSPDFEIGTLARVNLITNMSVLYRRNLVDLANLPHWLNDVRLVDYAMHMLYATRGSIHFIDRPMGVYRQSETAIWSRADQFDKHKMALSVRMHLLDHLSSLSDLRLPPETIPNLRRATLNHIAAMLDTAANSPEKTAEALRFLKIVAPDMAPDSLRAPHASHRPSTLRRLSTGLRRLITPLIPLPRP